MKKEKVTPVHYDILGNEIQVGTYVAAIAPGGYRNLQIFVVTKLNPKMVGVSSLGKISNRYIYGHKNVYPEDMVVVDQEKALIWALKQ
jgi:hypothetical protein